MKFLSLTALCLSLSLAIGTQLQAETVKLSNSISKVTWKGEKLTGSFHDGTIGLLEGDGSIIEFDEKGIPTKAVVTIDMNAMKNSDIPEEDSKEKLIGHLKNEDFFDVANHPTAKFESTKFTKEGKRNDGKYKVEGNLTVRGKTNPITLIVMVTHSKDKKGAKGDFQFNRSEFGVTYNSPTIKSIVKEKIIKDEVQVGLEVFGN